MKIITTIFALIFSVSASFCQLQHTTISGIASDSEGNPIQDAEVSVWFNENQIAEGTSNISGNYIVNIHNYGKIEKVKIKIKKEGYLNIEVQELTITNSEVKQNITLNKNGFQILPRRQNHYDYVVEASIRNHTNKTIFSSNETMLRLPTGTFAYNKPGLYDPVYYYENISSQFTIVDKTGKPIPNARVEIKIPDDKARWGITDENGELMMHMQFEKGARNGKITISADGFRTKKMLSQIFYPNNRNTIKLHAVK